MIEPEDLIMMFGKALNEGWGYIWGTAGVVWTQAGQDQKIAIMVKDYGINWKKNELAKKSNFYYSAKDGAKWIGKKVADCSGLFAWAFRQLGETIPHGSNAIWLKHCRYQGKMSKGCRTDGRALKPGTAVFCYSKSKGNRTHIGLYVGNGMVIEASGTNAGVVSTPVTNGKWNEWGELKLVAYGEGNDPPQPRKRPVLRRGDTGTDVKILQQILMEKGYDLGKWKDDGIFGDKTLAAVRAFQKDQELDPDGVVGPLTWGKLGI